MLNRESLLKSGRLIPAGENCPFTEKCPAAKHCNRPKAMGNDFSCGFARAFDLLQRGGSLAQEQTINGINIGPSTSPPKKPIEDILSEPDATPEEKLATRGKRKKNEVTSGA